MRSPIPVASERRSELKGSSKLLRQMSQNTKCLDVPQICWHGNCLGCLTRGAETWVLAFLLASQTSGWGQAAHIGLHVNRFFCKPHGTHTNAGLGRDPKWTGGTPVPPHAPPPLWPVSKLCSHLPSIQAQEHALWPRPSDSSPVV